MQVINSAAVGQSGTGLSFFDSNNGIIATTDGVGYEIWATSVRDDHDDAPQPCTTPVRDAHHHHLHHPCKRLCVCASRALLQDGGKTWPTQVPNT